MARALSGSWRSDEGARRVGVDSPLADLLLTHGCGGLGFRVADPAASVSAAVERLHDAYRWNALSARRQELNIAAVARAFGASSLHSILGKGFAVARHYPGPGLRPYGDIDVYIPAEDKDAAMSVLAARAPDAAVDLHAGYAELDDRDSGEIRRRTISVTLEGEAIRLFGFEDHLRLLCLHAARHGALRAMWLCDIGLMLESLPQSFDLAYFSAGDPQRTNVAFRVLGLAHTLLGARLDLLPVASTLLLPPSWMEDAVLAEWGRGRTSHGARRPWRSEMFRPWRWPGAVLQRWPNAFEAAYDTRTPLEKGGSVSVQLMACLRRIRRFSMTELTS